MTNTTPILNHERLKRDIIVIGASMGGVEALRWLCGELPVDFPGTVGVVLHRSPMFAVNLEELYRKSGQINIREARHEDKLESGTLFFAPRDRHMLFHQDRIELNHGPKEHFTRPAIDPLFVSAARSFAKRVVGILLTGGGTDGVRGLISVKAQRGLSLIQDPREACNPSMPIHALRDDHVDAVVRLADIPTCLWALASGQSVDQLDASLK